MASHPQFMTAAELNTVQGIMAYLNKNAAPQGDGALSADVNLIDANGESVGNIEWRASVDAYIFNYAA